MQTSGIGFKRSYAPSSIPVWQRDKGMLLASGGFALVQTGFSDLDVIPRGTPGVFDEAARTFTAVRTGTIFANASNTATTYQVAKSLNGKQPLFKVGDNIAALTGGAAYPITSIDTSNVGYDVLTVGTTLGVAVVAGQTIFASSATGGTAAVLPAINGLLYEETLVELGYQQSVSVVIRGAVYARRIPYTAQLAALPGLAHIIFSQSK